MPRQPQPSTRRGAPTRRAGAASVADTRASAARLHRRRPAGEKRPWLLGRMRERRQQQSLRAFMQKHDLFQKPNESTEAFVKRAFKLVHKLDPNNITITEIEGSRYRRSIADILLENGIDRDVLFREGFKIPRGTVEHSAPLGMDARGGREDLRKGEWDVSNPMIPIFELRKLGFDVPDLMTKFTYRERGIHDRTIAGSGAFTVSELHAGGISASVVREFVNDPRDLRNGGYHAHDLKEAGYSATDLRFAGFGRKQILGAGFKPKEVDRAFAQRISRFYGFGIFGKTEKKLLARGRKRAYLVPYTTAL